MNLLVPLATSFLVPVFVYQIVMEKELKLRAIMTASGMRMPWYWLSTFVVDWALQLTLMGVFFGLGAAIQIRYGRAALWSS